MRLIKDNRNFLYVPIFGGLGNQMFQLAHGLEISRKKNYSLKLIDFTKSYGSIKRNWNLNCFGYHVENTSYLKMKYLKYLIKIANLSFRLGLKKRFGVLNEDHIFKNKDYEISNKTLCIGYWQNEKYFSDSTKNIRKKFTFKNQLAIPESLAKSMGDNTIAVHIRRGDYVSNAKTKDIHLICDEQWYQKAMQKIRTKVSNPKFFIFSDDIAYTKFIFKDYNDLDINFMPDNGIDWFHMYLMTFCKHFIISNSSYSWWGSFLSRSPEKIIIAPKYWFKNQLTESIGIYRKDFLIL